MSRTFRGRHLPVILGSARKIQFGVGAFDWRKREKILEPLVDAILGKPQKKPRWSDPDYRLRYQVRDQIEHSMIWPVANRHPWMWYMGVDNSNKTWYKRHGNRIMRRKTKAILHDQRVDEDWTGHFPLLDECFDLWSID